MAVLIKKYHVRYDGEMYGPGQPGGQVLEGLSEREEARLINNSNGAVEKYEPPKVKQVEPSKDYSPKDEEPENKITDDDQKPENDRSPEDEKPDNNENLANINPDELIKTSKSGGKKKGK